MGALRAILVCVALQPAAADGQDQPHLAQAWTAMSSGDGLPGQTGLESYIYEDCPKGVTAEDCLHAHVWNYGADNCIKIEVDGGVKYPYARGSETYYLKCDAVNCCYSGKGKPDVKKWDIDQPTGLNKELIKVTYLGKNDTTELNNKTVKDAEVWEESIKLPFTNVSVGYKYYITRNGTDITSHRIDYSAGTAVAPGSILYGDFKVVHQQDLAEHRKRFIPPSQCSGHIMSCSHAKMEEWNRRYFMHSVLPPPQLAMIV